MRKTFLLSIFAIAILTLPDNQLPAVTPDKIVTDSSVKLPVKLRKHLSGVLTRENFESSIQDLYQKIDLANYGLDYNVFRLGMIGYYALQNEGALNDQNLLTIIDFSKPSTEKRFFTIDLGTEDVKFHTYVAHGKNTGENLAKNFSNKLHSNQNVHLIFGFPVQKAFLVSATNPASVVQEISIMGIGNKVLRG